MASSCSTVSITDIPFSLPYRLFLPALIPDHAQELAAMIVRGAGVEDGDIGRRRGVVDAAGEAFGDVAVAVPRARGKPGGQHLRWRSDRDHHDIPIGLAKCGDHRA